VEFFGAAVVELLPPEVILFPAFLVLALLPSCCPSNVVPCFPGITFPSCDFSIPFNVVAFGLAIFLFFITICVLFPGGRFAIFGMVLTFPMPVLLEPPPPLVA
jgi:hypothetical protein